MGYSLKAPNMQVITTPRISLADGEPTARQYIESALVRLKVATTHPPQVTYLDAGIMNYVYRVDLPGRTYFLKQALPQVKEHRRLGPDLAGVPPTRIRAEYRALTLLDARLPPRFRSQVPRAAWFDDANNVLWTDQVLQSGESLQALLQDGCCRPQVAAGTGRLLGAIHSAADAPPLWGSEAEDEANWDRFLRMRTVSVLEGSRPGPEAESLVHRLRARAQIRRRVGMISHLDAAPKNVLVNRGTDEVALLDFELGAAVSDPAYDPGFLMGHLLLMGENLPAMRSTSQSAAGQVAAGYRETAPAVDSEWEERAWRYAALVMLYRVYGSSPAPYLDPERFTDIRQAALSLLLAGRPK